MTAAVGLCGFVLSFLGTGNLAAAEVSLNLGWDQTVRLGRWNIASVTTTAESAGQYQLQCLAPDPEGHIAAFESPPVEVAANAAVHLEVPYLLGRPDGQLRFELRQDGTVLWQQTVRPGSGHLSPNRPLVFTDQLIVTVGKPKGFPSLNSEAGLPGKTGRHVVDVPAEATLPQSPLAYDSIDWLVLSGTPALEDASLTAIRLWVQQGGRLIVSLPVSSKDWQASRLREWLPATIPPEYVTARGLGDLEAFAGRNVRIPYVNRLEIPQLPASPGLVLASSRDNPLLLRMPWGLGEVLLVAVDLTQPPLANWGGLDDFVRKLVETDAASLTARRSSDQNASRPLTSSGITDLASQLMATQDNFPEVHRPAPWWSMVWMLVLLAIVGPVDYVVVHRLLKRPHWTWLTLPLWLMTATAYAAWTGGQWNFSTVTLKQMDIIDVDAASNMTRAESWITTLSPVTARQTIAVTPTMGDWQNLWSGEPAHSLPLRWCGIPETTTGGVYRSSGTEWGRTTYDIDVTHAQMTNLPLLQWSTRTLRTSWTSETLQLVDPQLRNAGLGRLSGEVTHHLPGNLTDWMLVYGSRVYWLQKDRNNDEVQPWEPGQRFSVESPLTQQNDLKNVIKQMTFIREDDTDRITENRVRHEQTRYEVSDRSPDRLWQVLSFHEAVGGQSYTGLTNSVLTAHDLSRQLDMGRAVVFGRLEATPAATVTIDGKSPEAELSVVYVRLVLPVQTTGEVLRVLPKLGADDARK
ncbi:hypothetical protein GC163_04105 [bacterium]|nr:hypothetical protein [bacterium]